MREGFKKDIERYNAVAKAELSGDLEGEALEHVLRWNMDQGALHQHTPETTQRAIYEIQKKKQELMAELKKTLRDIDLPESRQESAHDGLRVSDYDIERRVAQCELEDGSKVEVSLGEILTDGEWGVTYNLDSVSIPREVRKRYAVEEAKLRLRAFLDDQILESEIASDPQESRREAYEAVRRNRSEGRKAPGILAEQIVRNFLKKLTYDHNMDFEVIEADVYQDVTKKIDFILHRLEKYRGVQVEAVNGLHDVGVQFTTIETGSGKIDVKRKQVARARQNINPEDKIQDVVLVQVFVDGVRSAYQSWKKHRLPGGPDKELGRDVRARIFRRVLANMYSKETIDEFAGKLGLETISSDISSSGEGENKNQPQLRFAPRARIFALEQNALRRDANTFSPEVRTLLDQELAGKPVGGESRRKLDAAIHSWFQSIYGVSFEDYPARMNALLEEEEKSKASGAETIKHAGQ